MVNCTKRECGLKDVNRDEYGDLKDMEIKSDPKQKLRREVLEKKSNLARNEYGIKDEDVF